MYSCNYETEWPITCKKKNPIVCRHADLDEEQLNELEDSKMEKYTQKIENCYISGLAETETNGLNCGKYTS